MVRLPCKKRAQPPEMSRPPNVQGRPLLGGPICDEKSDRFEA